MKKHSNIYINNSKDESLIKYKQTTKVSQEHDESEIIHKPIKLVIPSNNNEKINKSDLLNLEYKLKQQMKANERLSNKLIESQEETRKLKNEKESQSKEINFLVANLEKLKSESFTNNKTLEDNKLLIRKMESRLIQGSKNQALLDLNHNLQSQLDGFNIKLQLKDSEIDKLNIELIKKTDEIKILTKALDIKVDQIKYPGNIKASLLYDVGLIKKELEDHKEHNDTLKQLNNKLQGECEDKNNKLKELVFTKTHLAERLVELESNLNQSKGQNDELIEIINEITSEKLALKEYINKLEQNIKEDITNLTNENKNNKETIKDLTNKIKIHQDAIILKENTIHYMNETINQLELKIKDQEENLSNKQIKEYDYESSVSKLTSHNKILSNENNQMTAELKKQQEKMKEFHSNIQELEKENLSLISKNKELLYNQDNHQNELISENKRLSLKDKKQNETIQTLNKDIQIAHEERDQYKTHMTELVDRCNLLIKEKEELQKEIESKTDQIETIKKQNTLVNKQFIKMQERNNLTDDEVDSRIDKQDKIEIKEKSEKQEKYERSEEVKADNSILQLIRNEKEKNKDFLEDIKKLKKSLHN